jgi:UDP-2,3-diacylglucosamine hydrolase
MAHGRTLFISDLHLDGATPGMTELFLVFLRTEARASDALYILGDLFETWIGDDDEEPVRARVRAGLRALTDAGVPCFIQHGNRDFLLGADFMAASGCRLLEDPVVRELGGRRFVLSHGDALCTQDHAYQRFRRVVRSATFQRTWRGLPLGLRRGLASLARRRSRAYTRRLPDSIADVTPAAVTELLRTTGAEILVHGHTHRPDVHHLQMDNHSRTRIVLGDWHERGNALAVYNDGRHEFLKIEAREQA